MSSELIALAGLAAYLCIGLGVSAMCCPVSLPVDGWRERITYSVFWLFGFVLIWLGWPIRLGKRIADDRRFDREHRVSMRIVPDHEVRVDTAEFERGA